MVGSVFNDLSLLVLPVLMIKNNTESISTAVLNVNLLMGFIGVRNRKMTDKKKW